MEAIFLENDYFFVDDDKNFSESAELIFNGTKSTRVLKGEVYLRVISDDEVRFIMCGEELGLFECVDSYYEGYKFCKHLTLNKITYWLNKIYSSKEDFLCEYKNYLKEFIENNEDDLDTSDINDVKCLLSRLF